MNDTRNDSNMPKLFSRFPLRALMILVLVSSAVAQSDDVEEVNEAHDHPSRAALCGTDLMSSFDPAEVLTRTAKNDPTLYRSIMNSAKSGARTMSELNGEMVRTFLNFNYTTSSLQQTKGILAVTGRSFRLWIDVSDTTRISPSVVAELSSALDSLTGAGSRDKAKGIIENDQDVFGIPPVNAFSEDRVTDFLMFDIQDGQTDGGNILGFFSPTDQMDPAEQPISNGMNLLYIDSKEGLEGGMKRLLSTIAHEYQHLIHYARKRNSLLFINEGCSEVASILNGYQDRRDDGYYKNTNVNFFRWSNAANGTADLLADYTRAMTWVHYLSEQYGEKFLYELAGAKKDSMGRVDEALKAIGRTDITWRETFKNFAVANHVQKNPDDPRYGFVLSPNSGRALTTSYVRQNFPESASAEMEPFGIKYYAYTLPGVIRVKTAGTRDYAVMAMFWKEGNSGAPDEIRELAAGENHTLTGEVPYRKIVLAIVNMQGRRQTVTVTNEFVAATGVENVTTAQGGFHVDALPNPMISEGTIRFSSVGNAPVSLRLYDTRGLMVSSIVDGASYEPGEHEIRLDAAPLATGVYLLRLTQGDASAARSVVIVK